MSGFRALFEWLGWFWDKTLEVSKWFLDGLILIIQYAFYWIFDGFCIVVESFFKSLDFSAFAFNYAGTWAGLPTQVVWIISAIGLPQGVSLLGGAYLLRLLLNLIPAALTRV